MVLIDLLLETWKVDEDHDRIGPPIIESVDLPSRVPPRRPGHCG
jgi:hypothetical protein